MERSSKERITKETSIRVTVADDRQISIRTGNGFFDHMLTLFAFHAGIGLTVEADGDLETGMHHTVEDVGITLGLALAESWGDKRGLARYGSKALPMDEALILIACDLSGRPYLACDAVCPTPMLAGFPTELVEEFFRALVSNAGLTLHIRQLAGRNTHHIIEAIFKCFGQVLAQCMTVKGDRIPSTKGVLA